MEMGFRVIWKVLATILVATSVCAQDDFEQPPIAYSDSQPDNCVSRLQADIAAGNASLERDDHYGYLKSLLAALDVPVESQGLVFSKTSLQTHRISPRTPRAIYYSDDVYVGFCQSGDVIEVSVADPELGAVFYTLDQRQPAPALTRQTDSCLICHSSSRTESVPGHLVRSIYADASGQPVFSAGSNSVNHTTPFDNRWGGWYVTGTHGKQLHHGNFFAHQNIRPIEFDHSAGQNITSLEERFDTSRYLSPHSDIVALMVLNHQVHVHNCITKASFVARQAMAYNDMMNEVLENKPDEMLESTTRRIESAGDKLVDALLFVGEAPLTEQVSGTSRFAEVFAANGPRDERGRSLRDFDMQRRMFKYPCSYLIYSEAFVELPSVMRDYVWRRLHEVLSGDDKSGKFDHLSALDRRALRQIISDTVPELPDTWQQ